MPEEKGMCTDRFDQPGRFGPRGEHEYKQKDRQVLYRGIRNQDWVHRGTQEGGGSYNAARNGNQKRRAEKFSLELMK